MIHHISIAAFEPLRVAQVLAELWQGALIPFPEHEDSYMALSFDTYGTAIVVMPQGTELMPGTDTAAVTFGQNLALPLYSSVHAAISVPTSEAQIREIADREGWHCARFNRGGFFELLEFWVENRQLLELMPPDLAPQYLATMHPENLEQFMATLAPA